MPRLLHALLFACLLSCLAVSPSLAAGFPGENDNLFPAAPAAKPFIDFDGKGFLVQGRRTFIVAGDLHYSRVPRALWRDRLLRIKRAGYNTVQTYTFWNYHELKEGQYDFSGDKDLDAYLQLIHSLGMYAIVRIGPYVNAEWEGGGWPVWLRFKPGVVVRENNAPFLAAMDRWMDHLLPIVAREQITHGGPVILVQLENEDTRGAGTDLNFHSQNGNDPRDGQPNPYFIHLRNKALALGIQVPHFFSGLNHSDNPAGREPLDLAGRTSPWYSTEFWTGWINVYGSEPGKAARLEAATWRVLAYGGAGIPITPLRAARTLMAGTATSRERITTSAHPSARPATCATCITASNGRPCSARVFLTFWRTRSMSATNSPMSQPAFRSQRESRPPERWSFWTTPGATLP